MKLQNLKAATVVIIAMSIMSFTTKTDKNVDIEASTVTWKGYKVTGEHQGTINLQSGILEFDNNEIVGGAFVMDMSTLSSTDLEGEWKGKLDGHLKSADFFGVENHPTAALEFTKVERNGKNLNVTADLTIKGITESITFPLTVSENMAVANLKIDRTKFDIKYGSASFFDNLKDKAIYDNFDLTVNLKF